MTQAPEASAKSKERTCGLCLDTIDVERLEHVFLDCGCDYHAECIQVIFRQAVQRERHFPARCNHSEVIPTSDELICDELPPSLLQRYEEKQSEYYTAADRLYCCDSSCGAFIPPHERSKGIGYCVEEGCGKITCVSCGKEKHEGDCVEDPNERAFKELYEKEGWQKCRNCGRVYEHQSGCNEGQYVLLPQWSIPSLTQRLGASAGSTFASSAEKQTDNVAVERLP
ncbi:hypothetical protein M426DRAFT_6632 [Hypoxylon sp. CI-4A]|nr:hypothetical protein M426DRAFT_6632 [Hypoxylon sp. CI-4A]